MKNLILVLSILLIACFDLSAQNGKWVDLNTGRAKEIIAGGTKVFVIGMDDQLYEWNGSTWIRGGVYPKSVAVDKDNSIWIVEKDSNDIKRYKNAKWEKIPGAAKQICAGGSKVFVIGMDDQLYEWNGSTWIRGGVYPKSVAVDKDNSIWIVEKDSNDIKRYKNAKWEKMPGYAKRVFAGGKRVLIIGTDDQMYEWNGSGWTRGGVYPTSIATDHKHYIWITNKDNSIRYIGWE